MLVNRIRSISGGLCAFAAAQAAAGVIVVPGDAASLTEAAQIAEEGDTIYCRGDLLEAEIYVDLDRKRLTLYSGSPSDFDEFRTGVNGGLWVLPDGAVLWGDGYELRSQTRVRDGAEVVAISTGSFEFRGPQLEIGADARLDVQMLGGSDSVVLDGPIRLGPGSSLEFWNAFSDVDLMMDAPFEMEPGSRLEAGRLRLSSQIVATDSVLDITGFDQADENSLLAMTGGVLRLEQAEDWPARVSLGGTDVYTTMNGQDFISDDFEMRDGSLVVNERLWVSGEMQGGNTGVVLERVKILAEDVYFSGDVLYSCELFAHGVNENDAELVITGDTAAYGFFVNRGLVTVLDGDLEFLGGLDNQGDIVFESEGSRLGGAQTLRVLSDLMLRPDSDLVLAGGARLVLAGSLLVQARAERGVVSLIGSEVVMLPEFLDADRQTVEAMSADLGPTLRGLDAERPYTWPIGTLRIASGVNAEIEDNALNHPGSGAGEALYVHTLVVEAGAELSSEGPRVYYAELIAGGTLDAAGNIVQIGDCGADLVEPFGTFDLADILAFVEALGDQRPAADYRAPFGVYDLADVVGFIDESAAGCGG